MRSDIKLLSSGVAAALVLAIGVAGAQARRFELSSQTIRAIWTELPFILGESTPRCPVTLEGSFHSKTLSKVSGELVGYITRARTRKGAENCASNWGALFLDTEEGFAQTLPWHAAAVPHIQIERGRNGHGTAGRRKRNTLELR